MQSLFCLHNLYKTRAQGAGYRLHIPHLQIFRGDCIALTGSSGCGKSTALDILGMVLTVDAGETFAFADSPAAILECWHQKQFDQLAAIRLTHMGFVLQTGGLLPFLSVRENMQLTADLLEIPDREKTCTRLAQKLEISHLLQSMPDTLSIGERQRVAIGRALLSEPSVILADEPTAALDPNHADAVLQIFFDAVRERKTTLVLATHDRRIVEKWHLQEIPMRMTCAKDGTSLAILENPHASGTPENLLPSDAAEKKSQITASDSSLSDASEIERKTGFLHTLLFTSRLALRDWMHETLPALCSLLALLSALLPILVLLGARNGIVQTLESRLLENPALLTILPAGSGSSYTQSWITENLAKRKDVAFVIPKIREISATAQIESVSAASARLVAVDLEPTANGDPLLMQFQAVPNSTQAITLSASAAEKLGVQAGDTVRARLGRTISARLESREIDFVVQAILPLEAESRTLAFVLLPVLQAMEDYKDGFAVPLWQIAGIAPAQERHFARFRLYAKTMNDVENLRIWFRNQGVEVQTCARDIQTFQKIREAMTALFLLVATVVSAGFAASTASSVLAAVYRKRRELGILRLLGFPSKAILLYPLVQTQATALCGSLCAGCLYLVTAAALDQLFAGIFQTPEITSLSFASFSATGFAVALLSLLASLPAALRATEIEPSEVLRAI